MSQQDLSAFFASILREKRQKSGLSQEKLAELAGVHPTHVGLIERGKRNPSLRVAQLLCNSLSLKLSQVIKQAEGEG
jgi:XRE family transcriptional regulator, regulator of sulfur utilization